MELLIIAGVDISHMRLVDLARLADQAKPFYLWVEGRFQAVLSKNVTLEEMIQSSRPEEIKAAIEACYRAKTPEALPFLFDGVGRTYPHSKACYYFFSWLIRDAPQQRLSPLVQRIARNSARPRIEVEIDVLTALITVYRDSLRTFTWEAVREVIIDRLEGSRRSIKGREKETVVRTALIVATQSYYEARKGYGRFAGVEIPEGQISIGNESYDVCVNLLASSGNVIQRILIPIKTRETEGGGHSHLFTRDIMSAVSAVKSSAANDFLVVIIVAKNWSRREAETLASVVDHLTLFDLSPGEFSSFDTAAQISLNHFIANVLDGKIVPKRPGESG